MTECVLVPLQSKHTPSKRRSAAVLQFWSNWVSRLKSIVLLLSSPADQQVRRRTLGRTAALGNVASCPAVMPLQDLFKCTGLRRPQMRIVSELRLKFLRFSSVFVMKAAILSSSFKFRDLVGICGVEEAQIFTAHKLQPRKHILAHFSSSNTEKNTFIAQLWKE